MRKRSKTLEEEKLQATGKDSLRPTEVDIVDANVHQLKARITELELQLDVTKAEGDAKEKQLRGEHADSLMEWQQKVEHLQNDVKKTTALRDTARSEVILLADELSVLKHQSNVNAEFSLSRQKEMGRANDTLRSSLDSAIKEEASIKRRTESLQTKAENYNSELAKRNEELVEIIEKLKSEHEGALSARQMRIDSLEEMLREYQSSLHETKTTYSRDLEAEIARLQKSLKEEKDAHVATKAARARLCWATLVNKRRLVEKHARFFEVSTDFSKSMKREYVDHAHVGTATIRSLDKTIKKLEKELAEMTAAKDTLTNGDAERAKELAEKDRQFRSDRATQRWFHFARCLRFKARHRLFFENSRHFVSALKDEIRDGDALKFKHAIAQAARDKRIKVLEDMVQEYENTLHETKTTYSQELEKENAGLRDQLRDTKHKMMLSRWASLLCGRVRMQSRHNRFLTVSKDFGKSMKKEAVLHAETTTKTVCARLVKLSTRSARNSMI